MRNFKRTIVFILSMLTFCVLSVNAQPNTYIEGVHYHTLKSANLRKESHSELMEVFWYGCGHCYAFEPLLNNWKSKNNTTIEFVRSPVTWNKNAKQHAQLYFVAETLGITEEIHSDIFDAIQKEGNYLLNEKDAKEFFVAFGIDSDKFDKAYKSFSVNSSLRKAESMQREVGIVTVPTLIVNQKYLVDMNNVINLQGALAVVDYLIAMDDL